MRNNERIIYQLQQLNEGTEVSRLELAELTGISPKNISRYLNNLENLELVETWLIQEGKTANRYIRLTKKGYNLKLAETPKEVPTEVPTEVPKETPKEVLKETPKRVKKVGFKEKIAKETKEPITKPKLVKKEVSDKEFREAVEQAVIEVESQKTEKIQESIESAGKRQQLKLELRTYISKLPVRLVDAKTFGFKNQYEFRAKINQIIDNL